MREMNDRSTLRVMIFPGDDIALRHEVDRALGEIDEALPEAGQISELQDRLRRWYRLLTVRTRDTLGGYEDDPTHVWYVYRDGRIRNRHETLERLYLALADARATLRTSESVLHNARTGSRRAGHPDRRPMPDAFEPVASARRTRTR
jgi:hypothetical protein